MHVYIAGPMTGIPEYNFPAFDNATKHLEAQGHHVFNPAEVDRIDGFDGAGLTGQEDPAEHGFNLRETLAYDLDWICRRADVVATLPGSDTSPGATAEIATAIALGLPVVPWDDVYLTAARPARKSLAEIRATRDAGKTRPVHSHGPDDGPGITCPESYDSDGKLIGECMTFDGTHREVNHQIRETLHQLR